MNEDWIRYRGIEVYQPTHFVKVEMMPFPAPSVHQSKRDRLWKQYAIARAWRNRFLVYGLLTVYGVLYLVLVGLVGYLLQRSWPGIPMGLLMTATTLYLHTIMVDKWPTHWYDIRSRKKKRR